MASTPEGKVKEAIKKRLKELGVWYYMPIQNGMGRTGIPDFICCYKGYLLAIEAKAPGKEMNMSENQKRVFSELRAANAYCAVASGPWTVDTMVASVDLYDALMKKGAQHAQEQQAKAGVQHQVRVVP